MELIKNQKGNVSIVVESYVFNKDRAHAETTTWRCAKRGCKSRCRTDLELKTLLIHPTPHEPFHEPVSQEKVDLQRARSSVKRRAEVFHILKKNIQ